LLEELCAYHDAHTRCGQPVWKHEEAGNASAIPSEDSLPCLTIEPSPSIPHASAPPAPMHEGVRNQQQKQQQQQQCEARSRICHLLPHQRTAAQQQQQQQQELMQQSQEFQQEPQPLGQQHQKQQEDPTSICAPKSIQSESSPGCVSLDHWVGPKPNPVNTTPQSVHQAAGELDACTGY